MNLRLTAIVLGGAILLPGGCAKQETRWEYKVLTASDILAELEKTKAEDLREGVHAVLNNLGREGWEVILVTDKSGDWLFKRPAPQE